MFKHPFSFEGRIRRLEYGLSFIIFQFYDLIVEGSLGLAFGFTNNGDVNIPRGLVYVCLIPGLWFLWAQGAKRCHDRDRTGWYQMIPFYFLWLIFADGEYGENDYGPNPKGLGNYEEDINELFPDNP